MGTAYVVSVFIHVLSAAFWIGGMLFLPLVILPGIKNHPDRTEILYKTGLRYSATGWVALALLLTTGLLNMHLKGIPIRWDILSGTGYGHVVSAKLLIFLGILAISLIHDLYIGRKAIQNMKGGDGGSFRRVARITGYFNLLFSLAMAYLGVVLSRGAF